MKKEFTPNSVKFIYTKNELAYQEVLDDFQNASEITIVTYDISTKREELIDALKKKNKKIMCNQCYNQHSKSMGKVLWL